MCFCFKDFKYKKYIHCSALWLFKMFLIFALSFSLYLLLYVFSLAHLRVYCRHHTLYPSILYLYFIRTSILSTVMKFRNLALITVPLPVSFVVQLFVCLFIIASSSGSYVTLSWLFSFFLSFVVLMYLKNIGQLKHRTSFTLAFPNVSLCLNSSYAVWVEILCVMSHPVSQNIPLCRIGNVHSDHLGQMWLVTT